MEITGDALTKEVIQRFLPLANLPKFQRELLIQAQTIRHQAQGHVLFHVGDRDEWEYFLIDGKVQLQARDGKTRIIEGHTEAARYALAHLRPRQYTATALTGINFLCMPRDVLSELELTCHTINELHEHSSVNFQSRSAGLLVAFEEDLATGKFTLPAMPDVAMRLRAKLNDDTIEIAVAAKLISSEVAVASRIVQAANSPLYRRGSPCHTIQNAITRMGLKTTRHIVLSVALRDVFDQKNPVLRQWLQPCWRNSVAVASTCCVLAKELNLFSVEEALLAGLVHDIGVVAVLAFAQNSPELLKSEIRLKEAIDELRDEVGGLLLKHWRFPDELLNVVHHAHDARREHDGPADLCDLVQLARYFAPLIETGNHKNAFDGSHFLKYFPERVREESFAKEVQKQTRELLAEMGSLLF